MDDGWFGQLYRTGGRLTGAACAAALPDGGNLAEWCVVSPVHIKKATLLHSTVAHFIKMDGETEDCIVPGALLNYAGVALAQGFAGTGCGANTRLYQDFDARMYFIEKE